MVLVYIAIAVGVLIFVALVVKILKSSSNAVVSLNAYCKKCGFQTNGLECPKCKINDSFGV